MPSVLNGIIHMGSRYIRFPYTVEEQAEIKRQFAAMSDFPNVIGAIDCTYIAIRAPSEHEFSYVNRKHVHTINVQVICDAHMNFTNIVARWPGATHDSFILTHSSVGNRLQAGAGRDGWLLGEFFFKEECNIVVLDITNDFLHCRGQWIPPETLAPHPSFERAKRRGTTL